MKYPDDLVINHSPELYKNVRAQDPKDELTKHLWNKTLGSCSLHINSHHSAVIFNRMPANIRTYPPSQCNNSQRLKVIRILIGTTEDYVSFERNIEKILKFLEKNLQQLSLQSLDPRV